MDISASQSLTAFTRRYQQYWQSQTGHGPASEALLGLPSPCVTDEDRQRVLWQPRPMAEGLTLSGVERALEMQLQPAAHAFYCTQYAGDMAASFDQQELELVQVWSDADHDRVQQNLIGHLLMQKRLKQSPTLFIGTTASELDIISLCNLTGHIFLEQVGGKRRTRLADDLPAFLAALQPRLPQQ